MPQNYTKKARIYQGFVALWRKNAQIKIFI